jgi:hypothetical protein
MKTLSWFYFIFGLVAIVSRFSTSSYTRELSVVFEQVFYSVIPQTKWVIGNIVYNDVFECRLLHPLAQDLYMISFGQRI